MKSACQHVLVAPRSHQGFIHIGGEEKSGGGKNFGQETKDYIKCVVHFGILTSLKVNQHNYVSLIRTKSYQPTTH